MLTDGLLQRLFHIRSFALDDANRNTVYKQHQIGAVMLLTGASHYAEFFGYMIEHSQVENGLHHTNIEALICLKAKAYLEIKERIEKGSKEDAKQLRKHKADVFRLTVMLTPDSIFELPETIQAHVNQFSALVSGELPDKAIFKEMGIANVDPNSVFEQLKKSFRINIGETH